MGLAASSFISQNTSIQRSRFFWARMRSKTLLNNNSFAQIPRQQALFAGALLADAQPLAALPTAEGGPSALSELKHPLATKTHCCSRPRTQKKSLCGLVQEANQLITSQPTVAPVLYRSVRLQKNNNSHQMFAFRPGKSDCCERTKHLL